MRLPAIRAQAAQAAQSTERAQVQWVCLPTKVDPAYQHHARLASLDVGCLGESPLSPRFSQASQRVIKTTFDIMGDTDTDTDTGWPRQIGRRLSLNIVPEHYLPVPL
jgi:hypothetical protein